MAKLERLVIGNEPSTEIAEAETIATGNEVATNAAEANPAAISRRLVYGCLHLVAASGLEPLTYGL